MLLEGEILVETCFEIIIEGERLGTGKYSEPNFSINEIMHRRRKNLYGKRVKKHCVVDCVNRVGKDCPSEK